MKVYKLTNQDFKTNNDTLWGEGVTHTTNGKGKLCSPGWLHYYHNPYLAIIMNRIHANISDPLLWEAEAEGEHLNDHGLKGGCTKLTTIKQIPLPEVSLEQKVEFGIRCAMKVYQDENWLNWAKDWLSGKDRSKESAFASRAADAVTSAYYTAASAVAYAAFVAASTASAVAYSSAYTVADVACAVACAADVDVDKSLDLPEIIKQVFGDTK